MAGKLSFSIAINLLTENFKKGASKVQSMFAKMKGSVLGFAAVLGIGGASLRSFIETTAGFEAAVSKLSAILGTTPDQIKALTDNAKKLPSIQRRKLQTCKQSLPSWDLQRMRFYRLRNPF